MKDKDGNRIDQPEGPEWAEMPADEKEKILKARRKLGLPIRVSNIDAEFEEELAEIDAEIKAKRAKNG